MLPNSQNSSKLKGKVSFYRKTPIYHNYVKKTSLDWENSQLEVYMKKHKIKPRSKSTARYSKSTSTALLDDVRSRSAIHFRHNYKLFSPAPGMKVHLLEMRQMDLLHHKYFCVNHPAHFEKAQKLWLEKYNYEQERLCAERKERFQPHLVEINNQQTCGVPAPKVTTQLQMHKQINEAREIFKTVKSFEDLIPKETVKMVDLFESASKIVNNIFFKNPPRDAPTGIDFLRKKRLNIGEKEINESLDPYSGPQS